MYGLKQAGQLWNKELNNFLTELGFQRCGCGSCLYRFVEVNRFVLLASEVDDRVITGNHDEQIEKLHVALKERYGVSEWGPVESFLGINCKQDLEVGTFEMEVRGEINAFLAKHPILNQAQTCATPLSATVENGAIPDTSNFDELDRFLWNNYASVVGTLIFLAFTAHPDIERAAGRSRTSRRPAPAAAAITLPSPSRTTPSLKQQSRRGRRQARASRCGRSRRRARTSTAPTTSRAHIHGYPGSRAAPAGLAPAVTLQLQPK